jgi:hypothetical protein
MFHGLDLPWSSVGIMKEKTYYDGLVRKRLNQSLGPELHILIPGLDCILHTVMSLGEGVGAAVREAVLHRKPVSVRSLKSVDTLIQCTFLDQGLSLYKT